jgi:hypothetical protein
MMASLFVAVMLKAVLAAFRPTSGSLGYQDLWNELRCCQFVYLGMMVFLVTSHRIPSFGGVETQGATTGISSICNVMKRIRE